MVGKSLHQLQRLASYASGAVRAMGSVEVDAKIRGEGGAELSAEPSLAKRHSLSRRDTVPYARSGTDIVLDLEKLNPDVNGDGKVSASELKIYNLLRMQDTSGDGKLTVAELYAPQSSAHLFDAQFLTPHAPSLRYKGLEALTKVEKKRSLFTKGFFVMSAVSVIQVLLIVGLVAGIVVSLKDQFVADNTLTGSSGAILKTAEATEELPLYVLPVLPTQQRGTLSTISISYADTSLHEWMVEKGLIGENDTAVEYPGVEETAAVLSFKKYNDTAADIGVAPGEPGGPHRVIRILNGAATLLMPRNDGRVIEAPLCAGKVSCASYTVEASLADELRAQATGNLTLVGVEVPTDRRLEMSACLDRAFGDGCCSHAQTALLTCTTTIMFVDQLSLVVSIL